LPSTIEPESTAIAMQDLKHTCHVMRQRIAGTIALLDNLIAIG